MKETPDIRERCMSKFILILSLLLIGCDNPKAKLPADESSIPSISEPSGPFTDINPDFDLCLRKENQQCLIPFAAIYGHDEYIDKFVIFSAVVVATTEHKIAPITNKPVEVKKIYLFPSHEAAIRCNVLDAIEVYSNDFENIHTLYRKYTGTYLNFGGYLRARSSHAWRKLDITKYPNFQDFIPDEHTPLSNSNKSQNDFCKTPYIQ